MEILSITSIVLFFLILINLRHILVLGRRRLLETALRKQVCLCFLTSVEGKRNREEAMPLERQTLNILSLCALYIAPRQDTEDNNSKASTLCGKNCVLGRRAFKRIKGTGTAGIGDL